MKRLWLLAVLVCFSCIQSNISAQPDPDRIAARLRIEAEIEEDYARRVGRHRRQLGQPKEVTIQVTAPLFSSRLFEYGEEAGDEELPANLDVAKRVPLTRPITFYGQQYQTVYVLSNGAIAFDTSLKSHQPKILSSNLKLVAPYWNRNDLRNGGHVYFREITSGRVLERGQSEIRYQYDLNVKSASCLLVTWEKMQPMGVNPLNDENTNTFQAAIFTTSNGTFANFIYNNIGWTQAAESGFNGGQGTQHYALPTSGTDKIMYLEEFGNTGIPGEWMFEIGNKRIQRCKAGIKGDTCDEGCGQDEWGADCAGCCHCAQGAACHNVTGECPAQVGCSDCWEGSNCQISNGQCREDVPRKCALNAISLTEHDRCGDPIQKCQCLEGYEGDGRHQCRDIDECQRADVCHPKATCTNTPGHYFCQCRQGYNGDGVKECSEVSRFLYPHQQDQQRLPKARGAKLSFRLRNPLKLFGEKRNELIITNNGLITVDSNKNISPGDRLDDMDVLGIAPFFANTDLSRHGEVIVSESTKGDILAKANQVINDNLESGDFTATSVVIVSYMNVSAPNTDSSNTYQTLLIGGKDSQKQPLTFVQLLYDQLIWSNGAEAGIMTNDKSSSIQLPGSGTDGIEQLSQLSNVRSPGIWLYRVDRSVVDPCIREELQPPYCDAQSPTLVNKPFRPTPSHAVQSPKSSSFSSSVQSDPEAFTQTIIPDTFRPDIQHGSLPSLVEVPINPEDLLEDSFSFASPEVQGVTEIPETTKRRPSLAFPTVQTQRATEFTRPPPTIQPPTAAPRQLESTSHQPIVNFKSTEFNEIPPDVFETTFPPFITVIPQVFSPDETTNQQISKEKSISTSLPNESNEFDPQNFPQPPSDDDADSKEMISHRMEVVERTTASPTSVLETSVATGSTKGVAQSLSSTPVFLFSTAKPTPPKKVVQTTKAKLVTAFSIPPPKKSQNEDANSMPFDENRVLNPEMSSSKLAIFIPISIVAAWLLILIIIAIVLCCQRRRTHHSLRTMYGPTAYQIRPMGASYTLRDPTSGSIKHYDNGIFEDHLEKSARFQSPGDLLTGYSNVGGGRMSLYGSYWNLSTGSARNGVDHLPHVN